MSKKDSVVSSESESKSKEVKKPTAESLDIDVRRGRPTKYRPELCEQLVEWMRRGYSFRSFAGVAEVDYDTVYEWEKVYPDFSDAKKRGVALQLAYDEKLLDELSKGYHGKSANASTHIFKMKNCHKWTDKQEIEQTVKEIKINIDSDDSGL